MNKNKLFQDEVSNNIIKLSEDISLHELSLKWMNTTAQYKYTYNFSWLGRPIIQFPQDIIAMQEIIWQVKPDLVIETGIAHGGSLIFYSSMMELLGGEGQVLGIDIDIRAHNRMEIEKNPMYKRITMLEGSSIDPHIVKEVYAFAKEKKKVIIVLDSLHTHDHVARELELYSPLVSRGSYLVVFDTIIEDMPENSFPNRPWDKGNNPKTAVWEFLKKNERFIIDKDIENKLLISVAPDGYLKCIKD